MNQSLGIEFWIPILISVGLAIWNFYQQIRITYLNREIEKQLHVHRIQFEKEFEIYKDIWSKLFDMRIIVEKLRPKFDFTEPGLTFEESVKLRLSKAVVIGNDIIDSVEKNKPFYSKKVYDSLDKIIKLTKKEVIEVQYGNKSTIEYWENGENNMEEILKLIDIICETIRDRIGNIEINE
jgi:hypothetical protein